ncbi:TPA: GGDEF domain-containing protein [Enterobacter cloacae subsp. cloacae]|nr:GGDEF domain-containing protein [Enterobacter cloacae subsp. cloacae]HCM9271124.1 GGDEF domain-containing protein [Enterobacter cloacae subsp. cloacae]HCM9540475.1 GGDEF domain-containing protein [Enterobacter cloacae subsp. cloacae]HCM9542748.1 GGDEF domain-containing protein [Enterobacter cloacae subsp. cloacae]HDC4406305.1 GGDEF domain-containing protein [Enterobacter cloacae]
MLQSSSLRFRLTIIFRACITLITAVLVAISSGSPLGNFQEIISNPGLYIDLFFLLLLIFTLWNVTCVLVDGRPLSGAINGLILWIAGTTFDMMDEIISQPQWIAYFCEDLLQLSGLLLTVISVYRVILRMNFRFSAAKNSALHDELTMLPNRRYFVETLSITTSKELSMMIIDIDFFKHINDRWGHDAGDRILFSFARQLAGISGPELKVFRIGGEEFAVIVEGLSRYEVIRYAESICRNARNIKLEDGQAISVSIGVAFRKAGESQQSLIKKTDIALYRAKKNGRNRIELAENKWTLS